MGTDDTSAEEVEGSPEATEGEQEPQGAQAPKTIDEVTIGGHKIRLEAPKDFMVCREIVRASGDNYERAICAALGVCWNGKGTPKTRYKTDYNALRYGGDVYNELVGRGVHPREIAWASHLALHHCALHAGAVPLKAEVDAAVGFSDAGAD